MASADTWRLADTSAGWWKPALTGELAAEAISAAREVAVRLKSVERVEQAALLAREQTAFPRSTHWIPHTVSQGYAGLAILSGYFDSCFADEDWDLAGRDQLERAVRDAEGPSQPATGLFSGLSGLAFAAHQLSRGGMRYGRLLSALDDVICREAVNLAGNLKGQNGVTVGEFDAISGLSGVGRYLLCRSDLEERAAAALISVLRALVQFVLEEEGVPRWHTPAHLLWDEGMKKVYPHGNLNCGLAHGIPGPLALLSGSLRAGLYVSRLEEAIVRIADWLSANRFDDSWGINWATAVPLETNGERVGCALRTGNADSAPEGPSRCAWCYGSPGIARALWMAGEAVDSKTFRELAIGAMEAVFRRPIAVRRIASPTFCHGVAGLLAITMRFANESGLPLFLDQSASLTRQILDMYQPESLLGFRNLEVAEREIDQPGLLDGAPGVALALLAATSYVEPTWDSLFLLS